MNPFAFRPMKSALLAALVVSAAACPLRAVAQAGSQAAEQAASPARRPPPQRSTTLTVTVNGVSRQMSLGEMAALPQSTLKVHNAHTDREEIYTGVAVADLLRAAGLAFSKDTQGIFLRSYVQAQGTDFYFVVYSASEVEPDLNTSSVIVATRVDGHELGADGAFKLISSGEKKPARWVHNLLSLTLTTLN